MIKIKSAGQESDKKIKWPVTITIVTFIISILLSLLAADVIQNLSWYFSVIVLFIMIFVGIFFDILGIAVTKAQEAPFHALAAKKERGAGQAIKIIRNAEKVSNIFNDAVGDIAGIISGSTTASIVTYIAYVSSAKNDMMISVLLTAVTAALTVGGKAVGKAFAIKNSNDIVYKFSKAISIFNRG
ncbi:MAG: hypothetical protein IKX77_03475 [Clostridia bacterium]|nr:hypothetical protein [Clostridia bacterium]